MSAHALPPPLSRRVLAAELAVIVLVALLAAWPFTDTRSTTRLAGDEAEFLTSSAHTAALALRTEGRLPLWQPYLGEGRPLLESPFAFVLNPFSIGPALLAGSGTVGVKLGVVVGAVLTAVGGWFLAWTSGAGRAGRLTLALLLLGKGNMVAMLGIGHYQLAVSQAYMPWILGAALLILCGSRARWPVVLMGLAVALQFLAGNVWHVLPTLFSVAVLTAAFVVRNPHTGRSLDWPALVRLTVAGVITLGLTAAVLGPLVVNRAYVGGQTPVPDGDTRVTAFPQLAQYVVRAPLVEDLLQRGGEAETRYNYTLPWWLLAIALVPLGAAAPPGRRRLLFVALGLFAVMTWWGLGGRQPFIWMYNNLPGIGRWRFVGRAYGTASLWLALVTALRLDALTAYARERSRAVGMGLLALVLVSAGLVVGHNWREWARTVRITDPNTICLAWLYVQNGTAEPLTVYQGGYAYITGFLDAGVRQTPIEAAYRPLPVPYTHYPHDLPKDSLPRYAMPIRPGDPERLDALGYVAVDSAPTFTGQNPRTGEPLEWPCAWVQPNAFPYAYRVRVDDLNRAGDTGTLSLDTVEALTVLRRDYDVIVLQTTGTGGARSLVVASEVAYPGWTAYVDGERVSLASVGGIIGAALPLSTDVHTVAFIYRPRLVIVGLWITVGTAILCIVGLLVPRR